MLYTKTNLRRHGFPKRECDRCVTTGLDVSITSEARLRVRAVVCSWTWKLWWVSGRVSTSAHALRGEFVSGPSSWLMRHALRRTGSPGPERERRKVSQIQCCRFVYGQVWLAMQKEIVRDNKNKECKSKTKNATRMKEQKARTVRLEVGSTRYEAFKLWRESGRKMKKRERKRDAITLQTAG